MIKCHTSTSQTCPVTRTIYNTQPAIQGTVAHEVFLKLFSLLKGWSSGSSGIASPKNGREKSEVHNCQTPCG